MSEVLVFSQPRQIDFEFVEDLPLDVKEVHVRTLYSGISAGTELTALPVGVQVWQATGP